MSLTDEKHQGLVLKIFRFRNPAGLGKIPPLEHVLQRELQLAHVRARAADLAEGR